MSVASIFRICPTTGLKVDRSAENLIKANAVAAVVFLLIGGLFGLSIALTRWPAVHLLPADWFYIALTAHGFDVLLAWIIFFEMAVLYFASAILLNCRLAAPRWAWAAFGLMLVGAITANVAVLQGNSTVMFTSYPPLMAAPHAQHDGLRPRDHRVHHRPRMKWSPQARWRTLPPGSCQGPRRGPGAVRQRPGSAGSVAGSLVRI